MNRLLLLAAFAALAPAAFAQDSAAPAAPAAADAPAATAVPPPNCTAPTIQTDSDGKLKNVKELNKQAKVYEACINNYVNDQRQQAHDAQKVALAHQAEAQAHEDASNAAVRTFNQFAQQMNSYNKAAQQPKADGDAK